MKQTLEKLIQEGLAALGVEGAKFTVEHPTNIAFGDFSTNAGIVSKKAQDLLDWLNTNKPEGVETIELKSGFINFHLSKKFFAESLKTILDKGEMFGRGKHAEGFRVMIEHTQPNPFKSFHAGHLMNNTIGEAVARIISANGAEVKTASYHGDKGMHIAMTVYSLYESYLADKAKFEIDLFNPPIDEEDLKKEIARNRPRLFYRYSNVSGWRFSKR